jgi:hypothetical protein
MIQDAGLYYLIDFRNPQWPARPTVDELRAVEFVLDEVEPE